MTEQLVDLAQLDFSFGTPCPRNNPYCGNVDRHNHGSFACETRCPCRSGFSEEARIQAAKGWEVQRTADDYLRKLLSEHFGLNTNSPDYNDQLWINGFVPPVCIPEVALGQLSATHFGLDIHEHYLEFARQPPICIPATEEKRTYDYVELNFDQVNALVGAKYAIKSYNDYNSREGDAWKTNAAQALVVKENNIKKARELGVPQAQIDRFLEQ